MLEKTRQSLLTSPLSGFLHCEETKILLMRGRMYYLWVARDILSSTVVYFMLSEVRSDLHVMILIKGIKEIKVKILGKELDDFFTR